MLGVSGSLRSREGSSLPSHTLRDMLIIEKANVTGRAIDSYLNNSDPMSSPLAGISNNPGKVPVAASSQLDQLSKGKEARRPAV